ncbi:MAG: hypothetical protein JW727_03930 [Candidatus Aenigmarchaeota archaeon]|nr:hypothetical protein [Candidatus Aenigmarchaeota archaeon]
MAEIGDARARVKADADEIYSNLKSNLEKNGWNITQTESYDATDGTKVRTVVGVSSRLGGSTVLSLGFQGVKTTPFYATVKEKDGVTEVYAQGLGSEDVFKFDFGRNKKVAEKVVAYATSK